MHSQKIFTYAGFWNVVFALFQSTTLVFVKSRLNVDWIILISAALELSFLFFFKIKLYLR
jgi:hypothetical protein